MESDRVHSFYITVDNQISLCDSLNLDALASLLGTGPQGVSGSALKNGNGCLLWGPGSMGQPNRIGAQIRGWCTEEGSDYLYGNVAVVSKEHFEKLDGENKIYLLT